MPKTILKKKTQKGTYRPKQVQTDERCYWLRLMTVHTASGAPGHQYSQQKVDYVMDIRLDENDNRIYGDETITYHNNSKDHLEYLWVQLDQNMRADDSKTPELFLE